MEAAKQHPCERVFGACKDGEQCKFKEAPREGCVNFLKGKCRFGAKCREPHFLLHEGAFIPALHPCIRIFGTCKFGEACECANLPSTTCLKFIRGKCAFGDRCKELHPLVPNMYTQFASALQQQQQMRVLQTMLAPSMNPAAMISGHVRRTSGGEHRRGGGGSGGSGGSVGSGGGGLASHNRTSSNLSNTSNHSNTEMNGGSTDDSSSSDNNNNNNISNNSNNSNNGESNNTNHTATVEQEGSGGGGAVVKKQIVLSGLHHPCLRVFGRCAAGLQCRFASMPIESCLRYLKGECKFGDQCREVHLDTGKNGKHPCARIFGYCKVGCRFQDAPADCCLQFLKGRCKFGDQCRELHIEKETTAQIATA